MPITSAAAMMALATPGELVAFSEEEISDAKAELLLAMASAVVRSYCGWRIDQATETLTLRTWGVRTGLQLPTLHLVDVVEIRADGHVVDPTLYSWASSGLVSARYGPVAYGWGTADVTALDVVHGYDSVPDDIKFVVLGLATRMHLNPAADGTVQIAGTAVGNAGGALRSGGLLDAETPILARHRIFSTP